MVIFYFILFYSFLLQRLPHHYCTNDGATHLSLAHYITQINLHHSNSPNNVSRYVIWAYGILFYFILFVFVTSATTSLPCQQHHHHLPPTHSLYYPAPPASFKWPNQRAGHIIWAYGNFFIFCVDFLS